MAERDERLYLSEILTAIERALSYSAAGRDHFRSDTKTQDAVIRNIEVIGEAVKKLSEGTRQGHSEVPWAKIAGTRDRLIHGYFEVDLEIIWEVVTTELPRLRSLIAALLPRE